MKQKVSPLELAKTLTEYWSPRVIAQVDDYYIKIAKLKGEFTWHSHDQEDELFMVLQGKLSIQMNDKIQHLNTGEIYVVPKGESHNPIAEEECLVMLFERKNTQHTGTVDHQKSRDVSEQLRPL
jgi:mannose-6-phosphate isomerase-like protein (cupin superfamily)